MSRAVNTSLPNLLVAGPSLKCPFFERTVVLLTENNENGAFGFAINKPSDMTIGEVFEEVGVTAATQLNVPVLLGGPVTPEAGWVLYNAHSEQAPLVKPSLKINDRISCSASMEALRRLAEGNGPLPAIMVLGYSGWSPGQLEEEMRSGSWIPVDFSYEAVFEVPVEERWQWALHSIGIDPTRVIDAERHPGQLN